MSIESSAAKHRSPLLVSLLAGIAFLLAVVASFLGILVKQSFDHPHVAHHLARIGPGAELPIAATSAGSSAAASEGVRQGPATPSLSGYSFFVPLPTRSDIGSLLQSRGYTTGVELGVQRGYFAVETLRSWPSCTKYYLVDIWQEQENYHDHANVPQEEQEKLLLEAKANLAPFAPRTSFLRNFTNEAVSHIPDELDFVYVDARHDYCGTGEDLALYWPKIRSGGLMAGHDYLDAPAVKTINGQDWSKCLNGTTHEGAVKGAVDEFFKMLNLPVHVTYQDSPWSSWFVFKP